MMLTGLKNRNGVPTKPRNDINWGWRIWDFDEVELEEWVFAVSAESDDFRPEEYLDR
jgi:hypothetical protein